MDQPYRSFTYPHLASQHSKRPTPRVDARESAFFPWTAGATGRRTCSALRRRQDPLLAVHTHTRGGCREEPLPLAPCGGLVAATAHVAIKCPPRGELQRIHCRLRSQRRKYTKPGPEYQHLFFWRHWTSSAAPFASPALLPVRSTSTRHGARRNEAPHPNQMTAIADKRR